MAKGCQMDWLRASRWIGLRGRVYVLMTGWQAGRLGGAGWPAGATGWQAGWADAAGDAAPIMVTDEAGWLPGNDSRGRPVALFQVDRHLPGEITTDLWSRFVVYNAEQTIAERGVAVGPGGQFSLIVDRTKSSIRNQDPRLAIAVLPALTAHYPELLGSVYVAPINRIFWAVWRVVRLFLAPQTREKFVLIRGKDWRERLAEAG